MKKILLSLLILYSTTSFCEEKVLVCLHGFMRSKSNMSLFKSEFKKVGWKVHVWAYPSRHDTIEGHAEEFASYLNELSLQYPDTDFHYVTHSMGGLVLRCALNRDDCPESVKNGKAILIAPPNRGSSYGRFLSRFKKVHEMAGEHAGRQLLTTKRNGFDYLGVFPETMKVLVIAGTCGFNPTIKGANDGKVGTDETRLPTPHHYKEIYAGHSWICHTPKTVETALDFFQNETFE